MDCALGTSRRVYVVALGYLACSLESNSSETTLTYASVLTLIPWIKSEGLILWSLLTALGLLVGLARHRFRSFVIAILPGLLVILGWRVYLRAMHAVIPSDFARPTF